MMRFTILKIRLVLVTLASLSRLAVAEAGPQTPPVDLLATAPEWVSPASEFKPREPASGGRAMRTDKTMGYQAVWNLSNVPAGLNAVQFEIEVQEGTIAVSLLDKAANKFIAQEACPVGTRQKIMRFERRPGTTLILSNGARGGSSLGVIRQLRLVHVGVDAVLPGVAAGDAKGAPPSAARTDQLASSRYAGSPPYLFSSWEFIFIFLPVALSLFAISRRSAYWSIRVLIGLSLLWYSVWDIRFAPLLVGSIVTNWAFGLALARTGSRRLLTAALAVNLLPLVYYKYTLFLFHAVGLSAGDWITPGLLPVVLPLGLSFYTFQQIEYIVDVCKHPEQVERSLARYATFGLFFPHLVAGPIVQHGQFLAQVGQRRVMPDWFPRGCCYFIIGLIKKLWIADAIAAIIAPYFVKGGCTDASQAVAAVVGYSCQLYFDFSGYSDMAMGLGAMFGFEFPVNFNSPYKATSITDFWRRWHMTLSAFLRDYIYIPLGGNRGAPWTKYRNVMVTMLLGGLWHGAGYAFLIWGGLHGLLLCVEHFFRAHWPKFNLGSYSNPLTLAAVFLLWVPFRTEDLSLTMEVLRAFRTPGWALDQSAVITIAVALATALFLPNSHQVVPVISRWPEAVRRAAWGFGARSGAYAVVSLCVTGLLIHNFYAHQLDRVVRNAVPLGMDLNGVSNKHGDLRNNISRCAPLGTGAEKWIVVGPSFAGGMPLFTLPTAGDHIRVGGIGIGGQELVNWSRVAYSVLDDPTVRVVFVAVAPLSLTGFEPGAPFAGQGWDCLMAIGLEDEPGAALATLGPTHGSVGDSVKALLTTSIRDPAYFQVHGFCHLMIDAIKSNHPVPLVLNDEKSTAYEKKLRELWDGAKDRPAPIDKKGTDAAYHWSSRGVVSALAENGKARVALAGLAQRARSRGVRLIIYETPTAVPTVASGFYPPDFWAEYQTAMRSACRDIGVEYWDLSSLLPWTDLAMSDLFHPTLMGRAITLSTLCGRVREEKPR
ncbi:MAG: hypothetical protein K8S99_17075 [Planctomycetes bacterium]|nr:hypothetical protein [Planctomycetota bacterium]